MKAVRVAVALAVVGLLAFPLAGPSVAEAQEQMDEEAPQTLVVSQYKCDLTHIGEIMAAMDSVARPVWQEVVDEGLLESVGTFAHVWGDEWNFSVYYIASDLESFFPAHEELIDRLGDVAPPSEEDPLFVHCDEHRDNIYQFGPSTEGP